MTQLCSICPRGCGVDRAGGQFGFCAVPDAPVVARAAPHFGEEPCISGTRGSGAVFFSGCNLRCVFCQNRTISRGEHGKEITIAQLRGIFLRLRDEGVHNINLVTPSHYTRQIAEALSGLELGIPVVWNSSGYECVETLRMLDGLVQVYLPDLKFFTTSVYHCAKSTSIDVIASTNFLLSFAIIYLLFIALTAVASSFKVVCVQLLHNL